MGSQVMALDQIKALADLPSREVLLSQLLAALNGVPAGFVRTLAAVPGNFLNALQAIRDQKEAA
jgi:large subunit ribosomal protein L10